MALRIEADSADFFKVKETGIQRHWDERRHADDDALTIRAAWQDVHKGVTIEAPGADIAPELLTYRVSIPPHGY